MTASLQDCVRHPEILNNKEMFESFKLLGDRYIDPSCQVRFSHQLELNGTVPNFLDYTFEVILFYLEPKKQLTGQKNIIIEINMILSLGYFFLQLWFEKFINVSAVC